MRGEQILYSLWPTSKRFLDFTILSPPLFNHCILLDRKKIGLIQFLISSCKYDVIILLIMTIYFSFIYRSTFTKQPASKRNWKFIWFQKKYWVRVQPHQMIYHLKYVHSHHYIDWILTHTYTAGYSLHNLTMMRKSDIAEFIFLIMDSTKG